VSDAKRRFLVYQLWELVKILHDRGLSCNGSLIPSQIWIMDSMWIRLGVVPLATTSPRETNHSQLESPRLTVEQITSNSPTERWCSGDLTNFEYLMILNAAAGRRMVRSRFACKRNVLLKTTVFLTRSIASSTRFSHGLATSHRATVDGETCPKANFGLTKVTTSSIETTKAV
jgi:hypothetical protein